MIVYILVGQAGLQVGSDYFNIVRKEFSRQHRIFFNRGKLRCIIVDSEPKVVKKFLEQHGDIIRDSNVIFEQGGRGNNWAFGFNDKQSIPFKKEGEALWRTGDTSLIGKVMDSFRKEVEACDHYSGCIVMQSLSGGTGSGLGSKIVSSLRSEYPVEYILSVTISPFAEGEVVLQQYNSLLALSHLQENVDGILLIDNDICLNNITKLLAYFFKGISHYTPSISFSHINHYISHNLAGLFLPYLPPGGKVDRSPHYPATGSSSILQKSARDWRHGEHPFNIGDLITSVCPQSSMKFLTVNSAPFILPPQPTSTIPAVQQATYVPTQNWKDIINELIFTTQRYHNSSTIKNMSALVYIRGDGDRSFEHDHFHGGLKDIFARGFPTVNWNPFPIDYKFSLSPSLPSISYPRSLTVCSSRSTVIPYIENIVKSAMDKYTMRAYIHWYERYGTQEEDFVHSFDVLTDVLHNYKDTFGE